MPGVCLGMGGGGLLKPHFDWYIMLHYVHVYKNMEDICETGPIVFSPYPRGLESLNHLRM